MNPKTLLTAVGAILTLTAAGFAGLALWDAPHSSACSYSDGDNLDYDPADVQESPNELYDYIENSGLEAITCFPNAIAAPGGFSQIGNIFGWYTDGNPYVGADGTITDSADDELLPVIQPFPTNSLSVGDNIGEAGPEFAAYRGLSRVELSARSWAGQTDATAAFQVIIPMQMVGPNGELGDNYVARAPGTFEFVNGEATTEISVFTVEIAGKNGVVSGDTPFIGGTGVDGGAAVLASGAVRQFQFIFDSSNPVNDGQVIQLTGAHAYSATAVINPWPTMVDSNGDGVSDEAWLFNDINRNQLQESNLGERDLTEHAKGPVMSSIEHTFVPTVGGADAPDPVGHVEPVQATCVTASVTERNTGQTFPVANCALIGYPTSYTNLQICQDSTSAIAGSPCGIGFTMEVCTPSVAGSTPTCFAPGHVQELPTAPVVCPYFKPTTTGSFPYSTTHIEAGVFIDGESRTDYSAGRNGQCDPHEYMPIQDRDVTIDPLLVVRPASESQLTLVSSQGGLSYWHAYLGAPYTVGLVLACPDGKNAQTTFTGYGAVFARKAWPAALNGCHADGTWTVATSSPNAFLGWLAFRFSSSDSEMSINEWNVGTKDYEIGRAHV